MISKTGLDLGDLTLFADRVLTVTRKERRRHIVLSKVSRVRLLVRDKLDRDKLVCDKLVKLY